MSELNIYKHGMADGVFLAFLFQMLGMLILGSVFAIVRNIIKGKKNER